MVLSTTRHTLNLPFGAVLVFLYFSCITVVFFVFLAVMLYIPFLVCTAYVILYSLYVA